MEVKGKFVKVVSRGEVTKKDGSKVVDRNGNAMEKMIFVIQLPYAAKEKFLALETINAILMNYIQDLKAGSEITVNALVESREWEGKWFTSASAMDVEVVTQVNGQRQPSYSPPPSNDDDGSGLPF